MTDEEYQQFRSLANEQETTDAEACGGYKAIYIRIGETAPADRAVMALYDVTP
jgi:hypothetical protein